MDEMKEKFMLKLKASKVPTSTQSQLAESVKQGIKSFITSKLVDVAKEKGLIAKSRLNTSSQASPIKTHGRLKGWRYVWV